MKVLLIKDVFKLGRAGDVKKVADGYGRNYLLPQGFAVLATAGALKKVEQIRAQANARRNLLNEEMGGVAESLKDIVLTFSVKAGETGKLYGSITSQMIADAIKEKTQIEIDRRQVEAEPIRVLGEHKAHIRLTIDLIPEIKIIVLREGVAVKETAAKPAKGKEAATQPAEEPKVEEPAAE